MVNAILFKKVDYSLSKLILDVEHGDIGLPDIQRPFVWKPVKVRDLFDSMYKGFPVGYFLFWANENTDDARQIGAEGKQRKIPKLLIVDGQQRLTSLYAVLKGHPIVTKDFRRTRIRIAFRPLDGVFSVTDAAIERDPEYIPDITVLWADETNMFQFTMEFLGKLAKSRDTGIDEAERRLISDNIARLYALQSYPFTALEISSTVDEEQVADIFVRINSKGVTLKQADFILTLLSVFWDEGRSQLEDFCRACKAPAPPGEGPSPFNHFIEPSPDQLLRVSVGLGFRRARLRQVYSILRGKDLETEQFSAELRDEQFEVLKKAQAKVLDLTNWHEFMKALVRAGFRSRSMITSESTVLYSYVLYLLGRYDFGVDSHALRSIIARWFFMSSLTGRYTDSPESQMESDLARFRGAETPGDFVSTLDGIIRDALTEDYWAISLPNSLETSSARSPYLFAYHAALNLLDARVLFSEMRVAELLDPAIIPRKSAVERHHLFPKGYLKTIGITDIRDTNQVANYALVQWDDNIHISSSAPSDYYPKYEQRWAGDAAAWGVTLKHHALPDGWHRMEYRRFLEERRRLLAQVIRAGFETL